ncbi:MAG: PD-(D/E)XK nuclease family protein [Synergistaceae bacterium]|nr:PD-(D/E)XK nuclease family protein [Synergistaceae bacterium]
MEKVLRASKAGFPCMRNVWYAVNGYEGTSDERTQRIFDVGTCLEPLIVQWLRDDGWKVEYNPGSQNAELEVRIAVKSGIIAGHPDCIISKGEIQNALVDIKTMNDRSFKKWKQEGTEKSKSQYVTQLHIYAMGLEAQGRTIERLGIVGVNKNTSEMYIDLFDYDPFRARSIKEYAELVFGDTAEPEFDCPAEEWACEYCEYSEICKERERLEPVGNSELVSEVRK